MRRFQPSSSFASVRQFILLLIILAFSKIRFPAVSGVRSLTQKRMATFISSLQDSVATVHSVPMFSDNYGHIIISPGIISKNNKPVAAVVDPGDGHVIHRAVEELGLDLELILCTHKHADHVGGNEYLVSKYPDVRVFGPSYESIPAITDPVSDGQTFQFGERLNVQVIYTPCHTSGHIVYYITDTADANKSPILFCGDTLFVGGCGRFFEGTADEMLNNMNKFSTLPVNTQVYCAHEYTESNFKFLSSVDPAKCLQRYEQIREMRSKSQATVPSTIGHELEFNLFMHCNDKSLQAMLQVDNAVDAMAQLRNMKNNFK